MIPVIIRGGREKDSDQIPFLYSLTCVFSLPNCVLGILTTEVMTSSFPSVGSPKDSLGLPVQSPTAGISGRVFLSRMADSKYAWDASTRCVPQVPSQHPKGLIWKILSSSSVFLWKESKSSSPMFQVLRMAGNLVNMEDPWKQVDLSRRFNQNLGAGYTK